LPQEQLSRRVLEVDEESFKWFVRELAKEEFRGSLYARKDELGTSSIILGAGMPPEGVLGKVVVDAPLCKSEVYGGGRGIVDVVVTKLGMVLRVFCGTTPANLFDIVSLNIVYISRPTAENYITPMSLYDLYRLLYKEAGVGARPLLELARQAEEEGDKGTAGVLRRLYAILEASKDIIEEIGEADYGEAREQEKKTVERKVEEALDLLRKAKEAARRGDEAGLKMLLDETIFQTQKYTQIRLSDIIDHLAGERKREGGIWELFNAIQEDPVIALKIADIYDAFITAAEHFGLEVRWK